MKACRSRSPLTIATLVSVRFADAAFARGSQDPGTPIRKPISWFRLRTSERFLFRATQSAWVHARPSLGLFLWAHSVWESGHFKVRLLSTGQVPTYAIFPAGAVPIAAHSVGNNIPGRVPIHDFDSERLLRRLQRSRCGRLVVGCRTCPFRPACSMV